MILLRHTIPSPAEPADILAYKEKANLARIRDNQRRSRARRKEYLQELENSLRQCELQGVEASSEIQAAARRVAEENKKLRAMLSYHGVQNDSIEMFLTTSPPSVGPNGTQYGHGTSNSVQVLEESLNTRRKCCPDKSISTLETSLTDKRGREEVSSTTRPSWNTSNAEPRLVPVSQPSKSIVPAVEPRSQPSVASRAGNLGGGAHHRTIHIQPRIAPAVSQASRNIVTNIVPSPTHTQTSDLSPRDFPPTPVHSNFATGSSRESLLQFQDFPQDSSSAHMPMMNHDLNVNNCSYAADMITVMAGADPASVRADLGCLSGMDC